MPKKFRLSRQRKNGVKKKRAEKIKLKPAVEEEELEQQANGKRMRLEAEVELAPADNTTEEDSTLSPFQKFSADRILFTDPRSKSICILGSTQAGERGIVLAEKQPLTECSLVHLFATPAIKKNFQNDVYSQYVVDCKEGGLGEMRVTTVCPATDKHVQKYEAQKRRVVSETPSRYQDITKPFVEQDSLSLDWVFNILEGKSEVERVIYRDDHPDVGFVLVPDLKWDQKELENLYVLAIVMKRGVLSLRELRAEHLPMLRNVLNAGKREICSKYGVESDQLRIYFHYQPSCYHLHVHFTHLQFSAPKSSVGDAHLLEDVIDNIAMVDPAYYAKRTLSFVAKESSKLWEHYANRQ